MANAKTPRNLRPYVDREEVAEMGYNLRAVTDHKIILAHLSQPERTESNERRQA